MDLRVFTRLCSRLTMERFGKEAFGSKAFAVEALACQSNDNAETEGQGEVKRVPTSGNLLWTLQCIRWTGNVCPFSAIERSTRSRELTLP